jgi:hypothetical protein
MEEEEQLKADQVYHLFDPQPVRLLDVVFVGPLIVYAGVQGNFDRVIKWALIGVGLATIYYNGVNYIKNYHAIQHN